MFPLIKLIIKTCLSPRFSVNSAAVFLYANNKRAAASKFHGADKNGAGGKLINELKMSAICCFFKSSYAFSLTQLTHSVDDCCCCGQFVIAASPGPNFQGIFSQMRKTRDAPA
jgi:hypothetical protein